MNIVPVSELMRKQLSKQPLPMKEISLKLQSQSLILQKGLDRLACLEEIDIEHKPWQIETAMKVLRDMRGSAILADEVGLGKTIEAGLIIKELLFRGLVRSVLVLVPSSLVEQWKIEMLDKFGLLFSDLKQEGAGSENLLISSLPYFVRSFEKKEELRSRIYDLVVVDEAHALKNHNSLSYKVVYALKRNNTILMSATPVQNDLVELFNLVNIVKPGFLKSRRRFKADYTKDKFTPKNTDRLKRLLSEVMIRHRRANTLVELPRRKVENWIVPIPKAERDFHNQIVDFCRKIYQNRAEKAPFLLLFIQLLKQTCSSPQAAVKSLLENVAPKMQSAEEKANCEQLLALGQSVGASGKSEELAKRILQSPDQCIVYTEYLATMDALREKLSKKGVGVLCYHGGLSAKEKASVLQRFKNGDCQVLLSTESGGQGLNLQFCHKLFNYDLPWNPMRIEQRIGRVHRFGQKEAVEISTMATQGTLDEYILYLLASKINLFEMVVGEVDAIMNYALNEESSLEVEIGKMVLESKSGADLERRLRGIGEKILKAKETASADREKSKKMLNRLGLMET